MLVGVQYMMLVGAQSMMLVGEQSMMLVGVQSMMLVGVQSIHQWIVSLPAAVLESFSFQYKNFISPKQSSSKAIQWKPITSYTVVVQTHIVVVLH